MQAAAIRETEEEAGVKVKLDGILSLQYVPLDGYVRFRVIFKASPVDEENCKAKTMPDFESAGAAWVRVDDLDTLVLRGPEPKFWTEYLKKPDATIAPLSLLQSMEF